MFEGEDGLNLPEEEEAAKTEDGADESVVNTDLGKKSGAFPDAPVFARIATVVAGPIFNFILAFFFSMIIVGSYGADMPVVQMVQEDGAAYAAGLRDGDKIVSMDGKKIHLYREISLRSMLNRGEDIKVSYERDGEVYQTVITPRYDEKAGRYYMGLYGAGQYEKPGFV